MVRSIEIPEPLFEADVDARWSPVHDTDTFNCTVLVGGKFVVFEKQYVTYPDARRSEDDIKDEFLAEFADKFKRLIEEIA